MDFTELDAETRVWMLRRFEIEEGSGHPYRSEAMSPVGQAAWPDLIRQAISDPNGSEVTLVAALQRPDYWNSTESCVRNGRQLVRQINIRQASERLAVTEFNTWYVAGLAHRLLDEGETDGIVHRAAEPKWAHASCSRHEGKTYPLSEIIAGHRVGYWPPPGIAGQLSIPAGPGCHHTIHRAT